MLFRSRLERLLEVHGSQPEWWAEDVREAIRAASSRAGEPPWPDDLSVGRSPEQARELLATLLHRFGGLLEAWPALVQGAAELREDGVRLTLAV